jgi:hypothetical protein
MCIVSNEDKKCLVYIYHFLYHLETMDNDMHNIDHNHRLQGHA